MNIDDEFADYMRLVHPGLDETSSQWHITKNAFFGGMMGVFHIIESKKSRKQQANELQDCRLQLSAFAKRATSGMERGFTGSEFEG